MKKMFVMALMATMMVSCEKCELDEACATVKEKEQAKPKDVNFQIFNDKLKGGKGDDVPQNQGGGQSKPTQQ